MFHRLPSPPALIAALSIIFAAAAPAFGDTDLGYRRAADALIVKLTEAPGEIDVSQGSPSVAIYGDGRAVVHRPPYMKNPGDHAFRLSTAELDRLVASLVAKNLPGFDGEGARAAKRHALQTRLAARSATEPVSIRVVHDAPTTVIELHLTTSARAATGAPTAVDRTISWYAVQADAEQYPDVAAIQDLAAARAELLLLMQRADGGGQ